MDALKKPVNLGFASGLVPALVLAFFVPSIAGVALVGAVAAVILNRQALTTALREGEYMVIAAFAGGGMLGGLAAAILRWLLRPLIGAIF